MVPYWSPLCELLRYPFIDSQKRIAHLPDQAKDRGFPGNRMGNADYRGFLIGLRASVLEPIFAKEPFWPFTTSPPPG